eukprot:TRINITY_DN36883_c0_g1_i1.p1 TRINITY_DN36883_c0_g1~~TRINITY_DN36883_c0_g1_i1.p1  ORF type:complete len:209 (+),score=71.32 TRINITY_DN36883_c0_g1_i1:47-628(+)
MRWAVGAAMRGRAGRRWLSHSRPLLTDAVSKGNTVVVRRHSALVRWGIRLFAVTGWIGTLGGFSSLREITWSLGFLELVVPRKWQAARMCLDSLPAEERQRYILEFRRDQARGYQDGLLEWLPDVHPEVATATGLTTAETLRQLNQVDSRIMSTEDAHVHYRRLMSRALGLGLPHADALSEVIRVGLDSAPLD